MIPQPLKLASAKRFTSEMCRVRNPPLQAIKFGHLEGVPQPLSGDLRSPWLLTTYVRPGMTGGFPLRWLALDADLSGSISLKALGLPGWGSVEGIRGFGGKGIFCYQERWRWSLLCVFFFFGGGGVVGRYFFDKGRDRPK